MVLNETEEPIGCIGFVPAREEHYTPSGNEREVGYWVGYTESLNQKHYRV